MGSDQHHANASKLWLSLVRSAQFRLVTSEHVMDETMTLLARRASPAFAASWLEDLLNGSGITILRNLDEEWQNAGKTMRKYADQNVSMTDCLNFLVLKREKIRDVFGFDHHFESAGFRLWKAT